MFLFLTDVLSNPSLHPLVDSTTYAWNTTALFADSMLFMLTSFPVFMVPKILPQVTNHKLDLSFKTAGAWLAMESLARFDYTLLLLNFDRAFPFLYPLLPFLRGSAILLGFITFVSFAINFGRIKFINKQLAEKVLLQKQFEAIVETSRDAIIMADSNSKIIVWNKSAERIFGHSASYAEQSNLDIIIPQIYREAHRIGMQRYLSTGVPVLMDKTIEISALHQDGHEFPVELSLSKYEIDGKIYFTSVIRDITYRKTLEKKLQEK